MKWSSRVARMWGCIALNAEENSANKSLTEVLGSSRFVDGVNEDSFSVVNDSAFLIYKLQGVELLTTPGEEVLFNGPLCDFHHVRGEGHWMEVIQSLKRTLFEDGDDGGVFSQLGGNANSHGDLEWDREDIAQLVSAVFEVPPIIVCIG